MYKEEVIITNMTFMYKLMQFCIEGCKCEIINNGKIKGVSVYFGER